MTLETLRRLPENDVPDRAGFSFVIKARQQAHSRTMERLSQHRGRTTKTSRMVCHLTEIALSLHPEFRAFATCPTEGSGSHGIPRAKKTEACAPVHFRRDYCWLFLQRQGSWPASHNALKRWEITVPDHFPVPIRPDSAAQDTLAPNCAAIRIDASFSSVRTGERIHPFRMMSIPGLRRLPENGIPDCAGFSFVIKARQQAHSRTMSLLSQHRGRTKRQAGWYVI